MSDQPGHEVVQSVVDVLPDDAPDIPAGFGSWQYEPETNPRYNCLCCSERYLTEEQLTSHIESEHDKSDIYSVFSNPPLAARFRDATVDIYTYEAAMYAVKIVPDDVVSGSTPTAVREARDNCCPICGEEVKQLANWGVEIHDHDLVEMYERLREIVPDGFELSPVFDDAGYGEPAATLNQLVPGDQVRIVADKWSQSLGTPRGQTRDAVEEETEWEAVGTVNAIDDSRSGDTAVSKGFGEGLFREVTIDVQTDLHDEPTYAVAHPKEDGGVTLKLPPVIEQRNARTRQGHGGPGMVRVKLTDEEAVTREPWYRFE